MDRKCNDRGQIVILIALMLPVLLGLLGLAFDVSQVVYKKQVMQNAIDLSVLAGSQELAKNTSHEVQVTKDYWELNGFNRDSITVKTNYLGDKNKIQAKSTITVPLFFMSIFHINSTDITVSAAVEAYTAAGAGPVFDYVFFTNTGMKCAIADSLFDGRVRSNNNFESSGGGNVITGDLEVVGKLDLKADTVYGGTVINPASVVPMPVLSVAEYKSKATVIYDQLPNTNPLDINGIVFVNSAIDVTGLKVRGKGLIVTAGNIKSSGGFSGVTSEDYAALVSLEGNITITGGGTTFAGSLLAPKGEIVLTGGDDTYIGSVIGNYIRISNGGYTFKYDPRVKEVVGSQTQIIHLIE